MQPTQILMQEHRVIEVVLECLDQMVERCAAGEALNVEAANDAIDFFRNFADGCHHHKEEDCLFPLLESKGFSREQGPTGAMLSEHEIGRHHVRGMALAVADLQAADVKASERFVMHAKSFSMMLREHILKEDHCLFQMADKALNQDDQQQLLVAFENVEHDDLGLGTHEKYLSIAKQLAEQYGVVDATGALAAGCSCSGQ